MSLLYIATKIKDLCDVSVVDLRTGRKRALALPQTFQDLAPFYRDDVYTPFSLFRRFHRFGATQEETRQIIENMYKTASVAEWNRTHGKHAVYAGGHEVPLETFDHNLVLNPADVARVRERGEEPETAAEEDEEKGKKPMKEKALVLSARSLINQVVTLKSQGVYGDMALQALQPYFNSFGEAVKRSVTYGGDTSDVQAAVQAAMAPLMQEIATLKAQLSGQSAANVTRSGVPGSRAITPSVQFNPGTMTTMQQQAGGQLGGLTVEKKPFSQIAAIARKSVLGDQ